MNERYILGGYVGRILRVDLTGGEAQNWAVTTLKGVALRSSYYPNMGRDPETSRPLREALMSLRLAHLVPDLK